MIVGALSAAAAVVRVVYYRNLVILAPIVHRFGWREAIYIFFAPACEPLAFGIGSHQVGLITQNVSC